MTMFRLGHEGEFDFEGAGQRFHIIVPTTAEMEQLKGAAPHAGSRDFALLTLSLLGRRVTDSIGDHQPLSVADVQSISNAELEEFARSFVAANGWKIQALAVDLGEGEEKDKGIALFTADESEIPQNDGESATDYLLRLFKDRQERQKDRLSALFTPLREKYAEPPFVALRNAGAARALERSEDTIGRRLQDILGHNPRLQELLTPTMPRYLDFVEQHRAMFPSLEMGHDQLVALQQTSRTLGQVIQEALRSPAASFEGLRLHPSWKETALSLQEAFAASGGRFMALSQAVEAKLAHLPPLAYGSLLDLDSRASENLSDGFSKLSDSLAALYRPLTAPRGFASVPQFVSSLPPLEVYRESELIASISPVPTEVSEEEAALDQALLEETTLESRYAIETLLPRLDPEFPRMLRGAWQAASSTNPERVRHVAISLRELLTQVLHAIAPDTAVTSWSTDPSHYSKGKPTRRARLLYACRTIDPNNPLAPFLETDVSSILRSFDVFQAATHRVEVGFTQRALKDLLMRAEHTLRFLLEVHFCH